MSYRFLEFFAGGGMARLGLGPKWSCQLANDVDPKKALSYRANHPAKGEFIAGDVADLAPQIRHFDADLAWASFPCQDLSLAGKYSGLDAARSGSFWGFWKFIEALKSLGREPKIIAIENVAGLLKFNGGRDFLRILRLCADAGYHVWADIIDAESFVPQSRPRLFIIAVQKELDMCEATRSDTVSAQTLRLFNTFPEDLKASWKRLHIPKPAKVRKPLSEIIEASPADVPWHSEAETKYLIKLMSDANLRKLRLAQEENKLRVGTLYRRTRTENGVKSQRAEIRFDGIAGCLRTPAGGSSRQVIITVKADIVRTRLLSAREAARLMGLPDSYILPARYNEAYHLLGDGVVAPVVRHLAEHVFEPILNANKLRRAA